MIFVLPDDLTNISCSPRYDVILRGSGDRRRLRNRGYTLTKEEIITFAEQFDPQPFHINEEAAQDSMFGGLVASGLHTLCLSVRLFVTEFIQGEEGVAYMGGLGMDDLRWHEPVYPDDTLRVQIEVIEKTPSESRLDRGYVDFRRYVFTDDEKIMSVVSHNILRRKGAAD